MATVLDYNPSTNSLSISSSTGSKPVIVPVAGSGIDNNFSVPQTFGAAIIQPASAGTNNQTPFLQAGDMIGAYVVNGLLDTVPSTASLTSTMPGGTAYVQGGSVLQRVVSPGATYTYAASSDTYVDLSYSGVFTYSAVANGSTAPAVAADSLRLEKVVTDATAITGVTRIASIYGATSLIAFSGSNNLNGTSQQVAGVALSTSTTGGTIAASTEYWYTVIPIYAGGALALPSFPFQAYTSPSITTGSTTATNSNTISWTDSSGQGSGAISYNVYRNTVGSYYGSELIGNTTSFSFVDTGLTSGAIIPGVWNDASPTYQIPITDVSVDTAGGYDSSTGLYTIPQSGRWLVIMTAAGSGGSTSTSALAFNWDSSNVAENNDFAWTPAVGLASLQFIKTRHFSQGETVGAYLVFEGGQSYLSSISISMVFLGE